ncbi:putative ubiquinol-cytochrome c reductase complex 11 kda protein [Jaminaea rosea]|uniref:Cytochrome b-c1 complex subunit 8 n=1 Tax=Jaminaea rosea TaxID=1569628 RepID=A0A316V0K6_9BASI|nr:putative ubiquinol-cytochrome c reductase complex 11 kda protein [Jaminaea rosea]PWN31087.1 putative ubiquinol-cytochrome c reductase complex 11 kda protein [Jaminaea rosea]
MHPTSISHSGMPTGKKYMGWWGSMGGPQQKGITAYSISSNQQNIMGGAFRQYMIFGYKRLMAQLPYFGIPLAIGYGVYSWGVSRNHYLNSKAGHLEFGEHEE